MAQYYYLVSSLPMLRMDQTSYMDYSEFLSTCKAVMSDSDYAVLSSASLNKINQSNNSFLSGFNKYKNMINYEMAFQRAQNLNLDTDSYKNTEEKETEIIDKVRQAVSNESPLEAEKIILSLYWDYLERKAGLHTFDLTALLTYALRLQILSRLSLFTEEKGKKEFNELFNNLKKEIFQA